jgi:anti-sigma factor RsiW
MIMDALKLQAYVDGELSASEAKEIAAALERDPQAQSLHAELTMARTAVRGNEMEVAVPDSREFYWSKISREIERLEKTEARTPALPWWRKLAVPLGIAAVVACIAVPMTLKETTSTAASQPTDEGDTSTVTYYAEDGNVTFIWVNSNQTANGN